MGKHFEKAVTVVAILWVIYLVEWIVPGNFSQFGIIPRTTKGLLGIMFSPFIHGGLVHLIANSIGLIGLLTISFSYSTSMTLTTLSITTFLGGSLVWVFGSNASHIGASGWVYGLVGFLLAVGIFRKEIGAIIVSVVVFFIYGGLFFSMFRLVPGVSFAGHLCGFISGIVAAAVTKNDKRNGSPEVEA